MRGLLTVASALSFAGCWGSIGDPGNKESPCGPIPEARIRRLSHTEYRNTVRDLFPTLALPELQLAPDSAPLGFDNDIESMQASPLLVQQYNAAAIAISDLVAADPTTVVACTEGSACGRELILTLGGRAFRRPVTETEATTLQAIFDRYLASGGFAMAVEITTQAILQSPQFLYRLEAGTETEASSQYDVATRLSYLLWATMPDQALIDAASRNELATEADLAVHVDRMLADPRALEGFMEFTRQWLEMSRLDRVTKQDSDGWSEDVRAALAEEARLFLAEIVFRRGGTVADFLLSNQAFIGPKTAAFYGLPAPTEWSEVTLPDRRGFLMQAQFLAANGHPQNPSPVLRGLFVLRNLLCVELGSPPAGVDMTIPGPLPGVPQTNRQIYEQVTGAEVCQKCHSIINPLGFTFEQFDTFGRFRTVDNTLPVDASGGFGSTAFGGPHDLLEYLAASTEVRKCITGKYLTFANGSHDGANDRCVARDVQQDLVDSGGSLTQLMKSIAMHPRYLGLAPHKEGQHP
ncbi:MAG: DUF1592 domain-containing protein [Deltaproteobacteria bacterium]|nr:DUF1592 domain-containing protein [Deltaproteobacteria bacterium]